ncbi:MAG TPA: ankyrin repeat domain-containing protein [Pseudobacteroides sp.]|uniref:ankyrin repeat domain-containing protein n=1 Tax=Pseudobacteroides sp. TaxID=1968840 RepID=UPI002F921BCC
MSSKMIKALGLILLISIFFCSGCMFLKPTSSNRMIGVYKELHHAVLNNDIQKVQKILNENSIDLNDENLFTELPLLSSVEKGYATMAEILVKNGADIRKPVYKNYRNILELAVLNNNISMVSKLIKLGFDINAKSYKSGNAMTTAIIHNSNIEMIKKLVELGINKSYSNENDQNYLHFAAKSGSKELYVYFLSILKDDRQKTLDNQTALHFAAMSGNLELFQYLLSRKFNVYEKDLYGKNALNFASSTDILSFLFKNYAFDINQRDYYGSTPLITAFNIADKDKRKKVVKYLLEKGSDINTRSNSGTAALHNAVFSGDYDLVKMLIDKGANVNVCDVSNTTPLHLAANTKNTDEHPRIIKLLLDSGANKLIKDINENTPLDIAVKISNTRIIKLLR